jgi:ABC-type multidrug transport system ATPase subunit
MDEANRCDDLLLMRQGRIIAHTTPANLLLESGKADADEAFLELIRRDTAGPRHSLNTPNEVRETTPRHAEDDER